VADVFDNLKINEDDEDRSILSPMTISALRRGRVSLSRYRDSSIVRPSFNLAPDYADVI